MQRSSVWILPVGLVTLLMFSTAFSAEKNSTEEIPLRYAGAAEVLMRFVPMPPLSPPESLAPPEATQPGLDLLYRPRNPLPLSDGRKPRVQLPEGITEIRTVAAMNALRVEGTTDSIRELKELIKLLDVPYVSVSISFTLLEMSEESVKGLGVPAPKAGVVFLPDNLLDSLSKAAAGSKGVRIVKSSISTFNNCPVSTFSRTDFSRTDANNLPMPGTGVPRAWAPSLSGSALRVVPTVHKDGTIFLVLQATVTRPWLDSKEESPTSHLIATLTQSRTVTLQVNTSDGKRIGLLLPAGFDANQPDKWIALLIEARKDEQHEQLH